MKKAAMLVLFTMLFVSFSLLGCSGVTLPVQDTTNTTTMTTSTTEITTSVSTIMPDVTSINIANETLVFQLSEFSLSDIIISINYDDDTSENIALDTTMLSEKDQRKLQYAGVHEITIFLEDMTVDAEVTLNGNELQQSLYNTFYNTEMYTKENVEYIDWIEFVYSLSDKEITGIENNDYAWILTYSDESQIDLSYEWNLHFLNALDSYYVNTLNLEQLVPLTSLFYGTNILYKTGYSYSNDGVFNGYGIGLKSYFYIYNTETDYEHLEVIYEGEDIETCLIDIHMLDDGSFIGCGYRFETVIHPALFYFNQNGELVNTVLVDGDGWRTFDTIAINKNGIIIALVSTESYRDEVAIMDIEGNIISTYAEQDDVTANYRIVGILDDEKLIVSGGAKSDDGDVLLVTRTFGEDGSLCWSNNYVFPKSFTMGETSSDVSDYLCLEDGSVAIIGYSNAYINSDNYLALHPFFHTISSEGQTLFHEDYTDIGIYSTVAFTTISQYTDYYIIPTWVATRWNQVAVLDSSDYDLLYLGQVLPFNDRGYEIKDIVVFDGHLYIQLLLCDCADLNNIEYSLVVIECDSFVSTLVIPD